MKVIKYAVFFVTLSLASASAFASTWSYSSGADGVTWTLTQQSDVGSFSYICRPIGGSRGIFLINTQVTSPITVDRSAIVRAFYRDSRDEDLKHLEFRATQQGAREFHINGQDADRLIRFMRNRGRSDLITFALYRSDNGQRIEGLHHIVLGDFNNYWGRHMRVCAPIDVDPFTF